MSAWKEYKKKIGDTRPWDIVRPGVERVEEEVFDSRMAICEVCPSLLKATHQCKQCGCFMKLKAKLEKAACPLGKW
jgi:hypothetical protein